MILQSTFKVASILGDARPLLGDAPFLTFPIFDKKKSIFKIIPMFFQKHTYDFSKSYLCFQKVIGMFLTKNTDFLVNINLYLVKLPFYSHKLSIVNKP
jgi:hypothetical protein